MGWRRAVSIRPLALWSVEMAGLGARVGPPDPYTSVLVLNLGATRPDTPLARNGYHWLYVPDSRSGFHRIGYYSNVDTLFLPDGQHDNPNRTSIYVETAFQGGRRPSSEATLDSSERSSPNFSRAVS